MSTRVPNRQNRPTRGRGGFFRRLFGGGAGPQPMTPAGRAATVAAAQAGPGYETTDISVRGIGWLGAGFIVLSIVGAVILWFGFNAIASLLTPAEPTSPLATIPQVPPGPNLQISPSSDLQRLLTSEQNLLTQYAWVNQKQGVVRIPIDQAMKLILQRGLPTRPNAGLPTTDPGGYFDEGHNLDSEGGVPPGAGVGNGK
jgi:hypothetical protein